MMIRDPYNEGIQRQRETAPDLPPPPAADPTAPAPEPPPGEPGTPPYGGYTDPYEQAKAEREARAGAAAGQQGGSPISRPPMPSVAPPTSATPISAGSFLRPGGDAAAMAPFRTPQFMMGGAPARFTPRFGPGTPMAGSGASPSLPFAGGADQAAQEGGGIPTIDELLKRAAGGR